MYEGKHIHFSEVDNKPLCSYSPKLCKQRRLNGYAFCIRHVLEDKTAPFKQCEYVAKYNSQRCTNPIPKSEDRRCVIVRMCGTFYFILYSICFFSMFLVCVLVYQILQQPPAGSRLYTQERTQEETRCFGGNASTSSPGVSGSKYNCALFSPESSQWNRCPSTLSHLYTSVTPPRWGAPGPFCLLRGWHRRGGDGRSSEGQQHQEETTKSAGAQPKTLPRHRTLPANSWALYSLPHFPCPCIVTAQHSPTAADIRSSPAVSTLQRDFLSRTAAGFIMQSTTTSDGQLSASRNACQRSAQSRAMFWTITQQENAFYCYWTACQMQRRRQQQSSACGRHASYGLLTFCQLPCQVATPGAALCQETSGAWRPLSSFRWFVFSDLTAVLWTFIFTFYYVK